MLSIDTEREVEKVELSSFSLFGSKTMICLFFQKAVSIEEHEIHFSGHSEGYVGVAMVLKCYRVSIANQQKNIR